MRFLSYCILSLPLTFCRNLSITPSRKAQPQIISFTGNLIKGKVSKNCFELYVLLINLNSDDFMELLKIKYSKLATFTGPHFCLYSSYPPKRSTTSYPLAQAS